MTDTETKAAEEFEGWCVCELMGHRRLGAYVTVQEIAGMEFLRLDVPGDDDAPGGTQYVNPASLYALTPTTEVIARSIAASAPRPVSRWDIRQSVMPALSGGSDVPYTGDVDTDGPF